MSLYTFATSNQGKITEIKAIIPTAVFLPLPNNCIEPQPKGLSLDDAIEVAHQKAIHAEALLKQSVIIEDTALFIESLEGFPGALVKFATNTLALRESLCRAIPLNASRKAAAHCILAQSKNGITSHVCGTITGTIALTPSSKPSDTPFGWDDIFIPDGYRKTFFELSKEVKLKESMRTRALRALMNK